MHSISKLLNVHYIHKNLFNHINCRFYFIVFSKYLFFLVPGTQRPPTQSPRLEMGCPQSKTEHSTPKVKQVESIIIES